MTLSSLTAIARRLHHHYSQPGADVSRIVTDLGQIVEGLEQCAAKLSQSIAPGHNPDRLTVEQVGDRWRLLEVGEIEDATDQFWSILKSEWLPNAGWGAQVDDRSIYCVRRRTRQAHERRNEMSEELKPCPFCGNELLRLRGEGSPYVRVHCDSCFADWKMEYSTIRAESSELTRLRAENERQAAENAELRKDKQDTLLHILDIVTGHAEPMPSLHRVEEAITAAMKHQP